MKKEAGDLIEQLADIEHQRWSDWQRWVQDERCRPELTMANRVSLVINADDVERWERQFQTPYTDLSEREKQSDREQVMRYWPMIVLWVHDWLEREFGDIESQAWLDHVGTREVMGALRDLDETRF